MNNRAVDRVKWRWVRHAPLSSLKTPKIKPAPHHLIHQLIHPRKFHFGRRGRSFDHHASCQLWSKLLD